MAIFLDNAGRPVPECVQSGFYWTMDVVTTGVMMCKAPVKYSLTTNQHPVFYRPDALPVAQPPMSEHLSKMVFD